MADKKDQKYLIRKRNMRIRYTVFKNIVCEIKIGFSTHSNKETDGLLKPWHCVYLIYFAIFKFNCSINTLG